MALRIGGAEFGQDLRSWVDGGLMTLFFLVVGLEARREFDLGDLRERRRFVLPLAAGIVGMAVPIGIFLLFNAGLPSAHGWGVAMSTDTALALGLLAILGRHVPDKVRLFVLTIFVVDDLAALLVIAVAYSDHDRRHCRWRSPWPCSRCCWWWPGRCAAARSTSPSGWRCGSPWRRAASTRSSRGWSSGCPPRRTRRAATRWSRRPAACGSSASSRRPSWCGRPRRASPPRCRRTRGCRASTTRGRAS